MMTMFEMLLPRRILHDMKLAVLTLKNSNSGKRLSTAKCEIFLTTQIAPIRENWNTWSSERPALHGWPQNWTLMKPTKRLLFLRNIVQFCFVQRLIYSNLVSSQYIFVYHMCRWTNLIKLLWCADLLRLLFFPILRYNTQITQQTPVAIFISLSQAGLFWDTRRHASSI